MFAPQKRHRRLSQASRAALEAGRAHLRGSGMFAEVVDQCRQVMDGANDQRVQLRNLRGGVTREPGGRVVLRDWWKAPTAKDGHYVFRVTPAGHGGWRFHAVAYAVDGGVGTWSEDVVAVHEGYEVVVEQVRKPVTSKGREPKAGSRKARRAARAVASTAPLSPAGSSSSEGVVSQGTISSWELAVEEQEDYFRFGIGASSSEAITVNGKTLTEAEWESEAQTFHEEDFRCQFLEFSGLTEEAYVERKIQAEERNLKKRKQAGDAAKQAGKWN